MAQTFKDFVVECELYPYSRENFELMKECSELSLMEKYLENQKFIAENAAEINSDNVTLTESYFQESADSSTITALMEEVEAKKQNIFKRIWKGFLNMLKRIGAFFARLGNLGDGVNKEASSIVKALRKMTLTKEDVSALDGMIVDVNNEDDAKVSGKPAFTAQPFASELKLSYADGAFDFPALRTMFENKLAIALSTTTVVLKTPGEAIKGSENAQYADTVGAIPAGELISACKKLVNAKKDYHVKDVINVIDGASADVIKNGLTIRADTKEMQKYVATLNELATKVENDLNAQINKPAEGDAPRLVDHAFTAELSKAYAKVSACIAADIKIYNKYMQHRRNAITKISTWLNTRNSSAAK